jgi:tungstate transport system substrate-binding protein
LDLRKAIAILFALSIFILGAINPATAQDIRMSTTTSTDNSGLLRAILPAFEKKYGVRVQVIPVGTGKALKIAENGDVDVTLVHARPAEDAFVAAGHGVNRRDVMYNDFVIVGPGDDPAGIRGMKDVVAAMRKLKQAGARFVSRGDDSGTHQMELSYWRLAGVEPGGSAYLSAGQGMGEVLTMSASLRAYTLTDRATYAAYRSRTGLAILVEGDPRLYNPYGIIAVDPKKYPGVNHRGAMMLIDWVTSAEGQKLIADFKVDGVQLFFPSAEK